METYRIFMFTPHFPGNNRTITGLTFQQAMDTMWEWAHGLEAEGYTRYTTISKRALNFYRAAEPVNVRIIIRKEKNDG